MEGRGQLLILELKPIITVLNEVAKVMFLHLSVILFTGGGSASVHVGTMCPPGPGTHPPGPYAPPGTMHPLDQAHPPDQAPPWDHAPPRTRHTLPQDYAPPWDQAHTPMTMHPPPETATAADGRNPTGMHPCLTSFFAQNCMKMKEIEPRGGWGRASLAPPGSANDNVHIPVLIIELTLF